MGLSVRGAFHVTETDEVRVPAATLVLLGWVGGEGWPAFAGSPEVEDGARNPLDRWSKRVIDGIAAATGASPLYPFVGPPWLPFQRWAQRADQVFVSPLGILLHPDWGLWHSYRGALAFRDRLELAATVARASPCESCAEKPCLTRCPVSAFSREGYDVGRCRTLLSSPAGSACMTSGCLARVACPIGPMHRFGSAQAAFHMHAFRGPQPRESSTNQTEGTRATGIL